MKKEKIFKAIGEVDLPSVAYEKPQKNKFRINKIIAACAALAIAVTGIFAVAKANTSGKNQCGGDIAFVPTISEIISYTGDASSIFSKSETEYIPREDYYSAYKTEYNTIN